MHRRLSQNHRSSRFQKCYPRKDEHCFELPLASRWHREQEKRGFLQLFLRYCQLFRGILWCLFAILKMVPAPCYKMFGWLYMASVQVVNTYQRPHTLCSSENFHWRQIWDSFAPIITVIGNKFSTHRLFLLHFSSLFSIL